jgi:CarboxypepD_reg-like domain/TonB dependent receptor/TonB-dependent Receptor Plug Domain
MRLIPFCFLPLLSFSQDFTINGYVKDAANGEALIGATVYVKPLNDGAVTNEYGFYSITLPSGQYEISYSYVGFLSQSKTVDLISNIRQDIELVDESGQLGEVVVQAELEQANAQNMEMSTNKLDIRTIVKVPSFLGEADVLRSLQLMPGVSTVGEGASGFNVRGGGVGQNLVLLDEAPVYNTSHLFGFFSVFNPDAVKDVKLYKGAIPSRYGGRLASLLDVRMKEGNSKKFEVTGGIGTVFSRLAVEGPIIKEKASFIVAARRSYIDVLARPFTDVFDNGAGLSFSDYTLKTNYNINKKNRVYLSGYFGRDRFKFDKNQGFSWGNATTSLRWNHLYTDKLFSNVTFLFSKYDYKLQFGETSLDKFTWKSSISNFILKPEFTWFLNNNNEITFGGEVIYYTFDPANATAVSNGTPTNISIPKRYNMESSVFIGNNQKLSPTFSVEYGLRFSLFQYLGPGETYSFRDTVAGIRRTVKDTVNFKRGQTIVTYNSFQPRLSFKWQISPAASLKASYNRMVQYLHLVSNTTASNPLDVWTPTTQNIKPELGDQFALGYFRDIGATKDWEASAEIYYRKTKNQVDYIDGADLLINKFIEGDLLSGIGRAYGAEFYLQKKSGRLNGWFSYTLARTELKVTGINNNQWYPTRYDQTHNLKLAAFYDLSKRWSVSGNFIFTSGTPTTFPTSRYLVQGLLIPLNADGSRNNVRIPSYHRLDISFKLEGKEVRRGKPRKNRDYWMFSVYNVYGRKNPFSIYFSQTGDRTPTGASLDSQATQLAIIGTIIPSVSYNFKF